MADLDILQPEVREALQRTDVTVEMFDTLVTLDHCDYDTLRAELLRLAKENADLLSTIDLDEQVWVQRDETMHRWIERARNAEAELAAIKARIAGSPACNVFTDAKVYCCVPRDWVGKRVRLVVEE